MPPRDSTLIEQLVARLSRDIDAHTRRRAALHLLDWLGCAAAVADDPARRAFRAQAGCDAGAPLALADPRLHPALAVLGDGAAGSLLEMDDVHRTALLHPGPVIVPAALAAARAVGANAVALLEGIVCGYEIAVRLGRAMGAHHYELWHPTSTCGPFGAAAAAGRILGCDAERLGWALGNAGTRTGGLWQMRHERVPSKAVHTAQAALAGWMAADLARRGFAGPVTLLEGRQGLFAACAPDADPRRLLDGADAGKRRSDDSGWLIHEVSFKPWPACRHAHPAIDALLDCTERPPHDEIDRVVVETFDEALTFCDRPDPGTPLEARFSLQHAVAAAAVFGRPTLEHYGEMAIADGRVSRLRRRVEVARRDDFAERFPAHFGAAVTLETRQRRRLKGEVRDALGDPERPMDTEQIAAKARSLMAAGGWPDDDSERLVSATLALGHGGDLDAWWAALAEIAP